MIKTLQHFMIQFGLFSSSLDVCDHDEGLMYATSLKVVILFGQPTDRRWWWRRRILDAASAGKDCVVLGPWRCLHGSRHIVAEGCE